MEEWDYRIVCRRRWSVKDLRKFTIVISLGPVSAEFSHRCPACCARWLWWRISSAALHAGAYSSETVCVYLFVIGCESGASPQTCWPIRTPQQKRSGRSGRNADRWNSAGKLWASVMKVSIVHVYRIFFSRCRLRLAEDISGTFALCRWRAWSWFCPMRSSKRVWRTDIPNCTWLSSWQHYRHCSLS